MSTTARVASATPRSPIAVPRRDGRALDLRAPARHPVVLTGLLRDGAHLSLAELAERWGERQLPVIPLRDGVAVYDESSGVSFRDTTVGEVVAALDEEGRREGAMISLRPEDHLPGIDERLPRFSVGAPWQRSRIWVSPRGAVTPLHHEVTHNLLAQLEGDKEVFLYPPSARLSMYPRPPWSGMPHVSRVDAHAPDLSAHPRFAWARPHRAELSPGDVLFIPAQWWHWVYTKTPSLSHNTWFAGGLVALLARSLEGYKALRKLSF